MELGGCHVVALDSGTELVTTINEVGKAVCRIGGHGGEGMNEIDRGLSSAADSLTTEIFLVYWVRRVSVVINHTAFDGVDVTDTRGLVRQVGNTTVGKSVRIVVNREGETKTILVTLGRREEAERAVPVAQPGETEEVEKSVLGLTLTPLTEDQRAELNVPSGTEGIVVTAVDEASQAFEKGLRAGDVITEAGQQKVTRLSDLDDRIEEARDAGRKSLLLLVRRAGEPRFVALALEDE